MLFGKPATFFHSKGFDDILCGNNVAGGIYYQALFLVIKKAGAQLLTGMGVLCARAIKDGSS